MRDSEDIINLITAYLKADIGGGVTRINSFITAENTKKGDDIMPQINSTIVLGQRLAEISAIKGGRLNLDIITNIKAISNYDASATVHVVELSYILKEDFSDKTFLKSLRMTTIIKDIMDSFFKDNRVAGFMKGEIESLFTPERVLLGNRSFPAIASGIIYNITIF